MALFAVVDFRLMLHVAERAVVVVRGRMRIRLELLRLGSHVFALVALQAGLFIRIIRILHVRAVAGFALEAAGDVAVAPKSAAETELTAMRPRKSEEARTAASRFMMGSPGDTGIRSFKKNASTDTSCCLRSSRAKF